ncbi:SDR family oxidoreductase [Fontibacter flavus]|uniref:SDR family oxidoreductase n=1 Tax=Fontibacter flavus TaxID=654838 RepID=A0ABV6FP72_9BACT
MKHQVVWITGASSGIGLALVDKYLQEGHKTIISSRSEEILLELKNNSERPEDVYVLPFDLSKQDEFEKLCEKAVQAFGKVDLLINNGGISQRSLAIETKLDVDKKLMEVNFFGTVALSKALLPYFIANGKGHFAIVSSLVGKFGTPYRSAYAASKHALHGFFESLRAELYQNHISVTLICPGFIRTNVSINALTGDGTKLNEMDDAQEKGMSPEECAKIIYKGIEAGKEEMLVGGKEKYAVYLKRFFPGIFSKILRKAKVR